MRRPNAGVTYSLIFRFLKNVDASKTLCNRKSLHHLAMVFDMGMWNYYFSLFRLPRCWRLHVGRKTFCKTVAEVFDEKLEVTNPVRRSILRSNVNLSEAIYEHKQTSSHKDIYKCISEMYYITF
jgi:hypothetical protein